MGKITNNVSSFIHVIREKCSCYKNRFSISTFYLAIIFTIFNCLAYNIPVFSNIFHLYSGSIPAKLFFTFYLIVIYIILLWAALYLLLFKYFTKVLIVFICMVNSLVLYFTLSYHVIIDYGMLVNVLETDSQEVLGLVTVKGFLYVIILGVVPSIIFALTKVAYQPLIKEVLKKVTFSIVAIIVALVIILSSYKDVSSYARQNRNSIIAFLPYSWIRASVKVIKIKVTPEPKFVITTGDAKLNPAWKKINKRNTVFVFILGETSRQKNFSLYGYAKDTNFFLKKEKLILFHNTQSCGTATAISLPCMFSDLNRSNFSYKKAKYQTTLLDILAAVDFDVLWIDNQSKNCKGVCDRVRSHRIKHQRISTYEGAYDEVLVAELKEQIPFMLKHNKPKFIVLHVMGSHGPTYSLRYPKKFERYRPSCKTADFQQCSQDEIINAYDNTIYYQSYVIEQVIAYLKSLRNLNIAVVYMSDHGESLGEHDMYLHGFPYKLAPKEQTTVPFFMWVNKGFKRNFLPISTSCLNSITKKEYSQDNLYHSLLGLLKVESSTYNKKLDIFNPCAR
ncbi:Phosphoethanolamine transferase [Candidatus Hepatincola sp. Av]